MYAFYKVSSSSGYYRCCKRGLNDSGVQGWNTNERKVEKKRASTFKGISLNY